MSSLIIWDELKIPKLNTSGKNWPSWKAKLEHALGTRRLKGYLHGTVLILMDPAEQHSPVWIPTTMTELQEVEVLDKRLARVMLM